MIKARRLVQSLRFKLISTAILVEVIMLSLLVWNSTRLMEQNLLNQMDHRIEELQPLLNASLGGPMLQSDVVTIQEVLQQFKTEEIKYYAVYNNADEMLVSSGSALIAGLSVEALEKDTKFSKIDGSTFFLHMPILVYKRSIGYLQLEIDIDFINMAIQTVRQQGLVIALAEILLSVLLLSIIGIALTQHLQDLTRAAHSMAGGDLSVRIKVKTQDEIGEAAKTFNIMADHIYESQRSLTESEHQVRLLNEGLEQRVQQRTKELEHSNSQLNQSLEQLQLAQEQLVQAEKMAALGTLVAGVAHEINTPVGLGVTTASYLENQVSEFQQKYQQGKVSREDFESFQAFVIKSTRIITQNLNRAAELIRSFKTVAVDQASEVIRRFNVCKYLDEIMQSLHPKLRETQHSVTINCPDNISVSSYPGALSQIITNLVVNSLIHGFDGIDKGQIEIEVSLQDEYLCLEYKDNGKGMNEEVRKKVFDPFFTTRRGDEGTGLGMHVVYNLIAQTFSGQIECESEPGKGVFFKIRLRVAEN